MMIVSILFFVAGVFLSSICWTLWLIHAMGPDVPPACPMDTMHTGLDRTQTGGGR